MSEDVKGVMMSQNVSTCRIWRKVCMLASKYMIQLPTRNEGKSEHAMCDDNKAVNGMNGRQRANPQCALQRTWGCTWTFKEKLHHMHAEGSRPWLILKKTGPVSAKLCSFKKLPTLWPAADSCISLLYPIYTMGASVVYFFKWNPEVGAWTAWGVSSETFLSNRYSHMNADHSAAGKVCQTYQICTKQSGNRHEESLIWPITRINGGSIMSSTLLMMLPCVFN